MTNIQTWVDAGDKDRPRLPPSGFYYEEFLAREATDVIEKSGIYN